jgi:hypothetical protein
MSYERVNDSSDSEGDVATSSPGHPIPRTPSDRLASLARSTNFSTHRYARVSAIDEEGEASAGRGKEDKEKPVDSSRSDEIEIHVRFNEGQDLSLRVSRTDTIAQFKDKVRDERTNDFLLIIPLFFFLLFSRYPDSSSVCVCWVIWRLFLGQGSQTNDQGQISPVNLRRKDIGG